MRAACGAGFLIVTPGVRLTAAAGDQQRVTTPRQAIEAGADYVVIGREVTQAGDPAGALLHIERHIAGEE